VNSTSMNNILEFVTYEALSLEVGNSIRMVCPVCNARHEKSFQITRTQSNLLYRCWRMACGVKGVVGSFTREYINPYKDRIVPKPRPLPYSTSKVGGYEQAIVWYRYKITGESLERAGVRWAEEMGSIVFPCYTIDGEHVGYVTKCLVQTNVSPKSLLFWNTTPPRYFKVMERAQRANGTVYLVEDCLSALKLWQSGVSSIALLGTKLDDSTALEIAKSYRKVVFCLDNDATVKAVELSRKYNLLFDKVSILVPPADPKDMAPEELENLLYAGG
jgi:hypothetical protein